MELFHQVVERLARITETAIGPLCEQGARLEKSWGGASLCDAMRTITLETNSLRWVVHSPSCVPGQHIIRTLEFVPEPGWRFSMGREGHRPVAMYERVDDAWRPWCDQQPPWRVAYVGQECARIEDLYEEDSHLRLYQDGLRLEYRQAEEGLRLSRIRLRDAVAPPQLPMMPEVANFSPALATEEGRIAYLQAAQRWIEKYQAACQTWSRDTARIAPLLPREGDAYVWEDLRVPVALFDFEAIMARLLETLDALFRKPARGGFSDQIL